MALGRCVAVGKCVEDGKGEGSNGVDVGLLLGRIVGRVVKVGVSGGGE